MENYLYSKTREEAKELRRELDDRKTFKIRYFFLGLIVGSLFGLSILLIF